MAAEAAGEVHPLDHTADVGLEAAAPDLPRLFDLAARGMLGLVRGDDAPAAATAGGEAHTLELGAGDVAALLVAWLRELLFLHAVHGLAYGEASFDRLDETGLRARVLLRSDEEPVAREIKGVTYHGLRVEPAGGGWRARVVFDV